VAQFEIGRQHVSQHEYIRDIMFERRLLQLVLTPWSKL